MNVVLIRNIGLDVVTRGRPVLTTIAASSIQRVIKRYKTSPLESYVVVYFDIDRIDRT